MSGTRIELTVSIKLPESVTDAQIEEWLRYRLQIESLIHSTNPLADLPIRAATSSSYRWMTL